MREPRNREQCSFAVFSAVISLCVFRKTVIRHAEHVRADIGVSPQPVQVLRSIVAFGQFLLAHSRPLFFKNLAVCGNGDYLPGNHLAAFRKCGLDRGDDAATTGYFHTCDGNGFYVVGP